MSARLVRPMVLLCVLALGAKRAEAIGDEYQVRGNDLIVLIDSRWAGNAHGGYYPIRIRLTNRADDRTLTFRFTPSEQLPSVERTIRADQNATLQFTLSVPMVGQGSYGQLSILQDGREIKDLTRQISLPGVEYGGFERTALLVVSSANVDCRAFEDAVDRSGSTMSAVTMGGSAMTRTSDHQVVSSESLPDRWIDYSGLDMVAISLDALAELDRERRDAVLGWTHTGGRLLVFDVGEPAAESERLAELLQIPVGADEWTAADPARRRVSRVVTQESHRQPKPDSAWLAQSQTFSHRALLVGEVYAFPKDPFPGTARDWAWFLGTIKDRQHQWTQRHGISARLPQSHSEFISFLIPGVQGVPVYAFLALMTVFTIVIGPLNYLVLLRRRRLYLMLLTIPTIALVTTVSLFAYSAVAHGFSVQSRSRSLTVLDQRHKTSVTFNRLALYAGLAPSAGLTFSPETAVFPIHAPGSSFESRHLDWTETQSLTSGWLKSRTRTQFLTVTHRTARGRITIEPPENNRMNIANGLEWDLEAILVADATGQLYWGTDLAAGAGTRLTQASLADRNAFLELLIRHLPEPPEGAGSEDGAFFDLGASRTYSPYGRAAPVKFANGTLETSIKGLLTQKAALPAGTYAAVLRNNPDVEIGVESADEQAGYHLLIGYY